jgi:hypothetical protein
MQLPIYHFKNFALSEDPQLSSYILNLHRQHDYTAINSNNFPVPTDNWSSKFLNKVYDEILIKAQGLFGPFTLADDNSRQPWAYVTDLAHYLGGIHEHTQTSTINAVYYVYVPRTRNERDGAICFYDKDLVETYCLKPATGDLVIFPNYLLHQPLACPTFDARISINFEIKTKEPLFV